MKRALLVVLWAGLIFWGLQAGAKDPPSASPESSQLGTNVFEAKWDPVPKPKKPEGAQDEEPPEPPQVLKAYDVSDLLLQASVPAKQIDELGEDVVPGLMGSMPIMGLQGSSGEPGHSMWPINGRPSSSSQHDRSSVSPDLDDISDTVKNLVDPATWDDKGGMSTMKTLGDMLVISTTEETHRKIAALLDVFRQRAAARKMVSVEVHWLWLTEPQLRQLVPDAKPGDAGAQNVADPAAWDKLTQERTKEDTQMRAGYHAIVTCMNGQNVVATAGGQNRFVVSMTPVVGQEGEPPAPAMNPPTPSPPTPSPAPSLPSPAPFVPRTPPAPLSVGYQPVVTRVQEGSALQVRPVLCGNGQVLLDVHSRALEVQRPEPPESPAGGPAAGTQSTVVRELAAAVDRPLVLNHRLDTTLRAPLGRQMLVGGLTRETNPEPTSPNLYVFIKASECGRGK